MTYQRTIRRIAFVPFLLLAVLACQEPGKKGTAYPQQCDISNFAMNPFPESSWYPLSASYLDSLIKSARSSQSRTPGQIIRAHGWQLFAGLQERVPNLAGDSVWRWQTWPTATQAMKETHHTMVPKTAVQKRPKHLLGHNLNNASVSAEVPINFTPPSYVVPDPVCQLLDSAKGCSVPINGCRFQNNGDIMVAGVIYNESAYDWIREQKLYDWDTVKAMWQRVYTGSATNRRIKDFPNKAMVLKPMFWPVRQDGYTALPVWRDSTNNNNYDFYSGFEIQRVWPAAVAITTESDDPTPATDVEFLYYVNDSTGNPMGPNKYENAPVVPISKFYHWQISQPQLDAMDTIDRAILDQSAYWCYNREFQAGDYVALIAMHVITKEMPSWTLQSFWWSDEANTSKYRISRDSVASPPNRQAFNNYLMTSTYGMNAINVDPAEWPLAFNPYIELGAAHPIQTNCRNCHQRGAFPNEKQKMALGVQMQNTASYLREGSQYPSALDTFDIANPVLDSLLIMDFQWTLTDRIVPPN